MRPSARGVVVAGVAAVAAVTLAACGGGDGGGQEGSTVPKPPASSTSSTADAPAASGSAGEGSTTNAAVSRDRAGTIATDKYGGDVLNVESDSEHGRPTWEVEIAHSSKGRIEVDVAKDNGEIVTMEPED